MIGNDVIKKLKQERPDTTLYRAELAYDDEQGAPQTIEFVFRKPRVADMESYAKKSATSTLNANMNLLTSIVVHPDATVVKKTLETSPNVVGSFLNQKIMPFFGDLQTAEIVPI